MARGFLEALSGTPLRFLLLAQWLATREKAPKVTALQKRQSEPFHAIAVRTTQHSCAAAKAMAGQRFLSGKAPRLPLPECDQASCECSYKHSADRRQVKRRDEGDKRSRRASSGEDRRNRNRRAADYPPEPAANYFQHTGETARLRKLQLGDTEDA